jgi:hypothetical protein
LAAQTRLAQSVKSELLDVYLLEILFLIADKGVAIQTAKTAQENVKEVNHSFSWTEQVIWQVPVRQSFGRILFFIASFGCHIVTSGFPSKRKPITTLDDTIP